jgi:hypothetical protein
MTTRCYSAGRFLAGTLFISLAAGISARGAAAQGAVSFKEDLFPITELTSLEGHQPGGSGYETSGLDLRTCEGLMTGTKFGSIMTLDRAFESNLTAVVEQGTESRIWSLHNRNRLSKCERLLFRFCISQGGQKRLGTSDQTGTREHDRSKEDHAAVAPYDPEI